MKLEAIMIIELSQTKANIIWFQLYVKLKKKKQLIDTQNRQVVVRSKKWGIGNTGEGSQKYKHQIIK